MGQEGYVTAMHATEYLINEDSPMEAVTTYAERATQVEEWMAQMESKFEEKFAMMSLQQPPQPTCYPQTPSMPHT